MLAGVFLLALRLRSVFEHAEALQLSTLELLDVEVRPFDVAVFIQIDIIHRASGPAGQVGQCSLDFFRVHAVLLDHVLDQVNVRVGAGLKNWPNQLLIEFCFVGADEFCYQ